MISFRDVKKSFGSKHVLRSVSFDVRDGEVFFIIGTSGVGKSVLIKHLIGLLYPDGGEIFLDGEEISRFDEQAMYPVRKKCAMVFQHSTLFDSMTCVENVMLPLRKHKGMKDRDARAESLRRLDQVHMREFADRFPSELGDGMRKRVAIARALTLDPSYVLFDEPTTSLDPVSARRVDKLIRELSDKLGVTSIVVSHDLVSIFSIADRIVMLYQGHVKLLGTREEFRTTDDPIVQQFINGRAEGPMDTLRAHGVDRSIGACPDSDAPASFDGHGQLFGGLPSRFAVCLPPTQEKTKANPKSIEVKVGLLIIVAITILAGFVLVMGGINFQPTYPLFVDFDNPGGVQVGAPVKIAGVKVGSVQEIQFRGGSVNPTTKERDPLVRIRIAVERRHKAAVHKNATFYVTTQGVLGEQFLAIDPGSLDQPVIEENTVVRGLDPPRLDMLLAEGYELLHTTIQSVRANKKDIGDAFDGLRDTLKGTGHFFNNNRDRLDRIVANVETLTVDSNELLKAGRAKYVDNPKIDRIIANVEATSASIRRDSDALLKDAKDTLANTRKLTGVLASDEETRRLQKTLADVSEIAAKAKLATADAQSIVAHIKKGDGSVGNLVMSEQLYDDIQELVRDLKHNPWKLFWKE